MYSWKATVLSRDLSNSSIHMSPCDSIAICEIIQGMEANVQTAIVDSIYAQDMYASASIL